MTQPELSFDNPQATGQCADVLDYMAEFGSITAIDAMRDLGCMRLASRISDLKERGYRIITERADVINRWGKTCHIARYRKAV